AGRHRPERRRRQLEMTSAGNRRGVTLLEMLIVVAIIATIASISFPAMTAGLAGVRLSSAAGDAASFFTSSFNRVERREQPAAIVIDPTLNRVAMFTAASGDKPATQLELPSGIVIDAQESRRYVIYPGGAFPHINLVLRNEKGARRRIQIDPVTAVPKIERVEAPPS
ncbi:MAG TPA: prepilin-type N-terminal cleavage/methylation domain-containing protein, partial [Bryobacteraceae bacterium]|nr:prepilin-type N-terminal cleavage/methylation domain-containing protein [Bryobacteraceae bacterium]